MSNTLTHDDWQVLAESDGGLGAEPPPAPPPALWDLAARRAVHRLLRATTGGALVIDDWAGRSRFGSWTPDEAGRRPIGAAIRVHHPETYRRVLRSRSIGIGDTYAAGWWDTDDLTATLRLLDRTVRRADPHLDALGRLTGPVSDRIRSIRRPNTERDRHNIQAHYDLGNEFFAALLDETMAYSSGIFSSHALDTAEASVAKFDRLCRAADLDPARHLLEIGSGWGGFAIHAARTHGCRVTTITLSDEQYGFVRDRVRAEGLADRVTVLPSHYRDIDGSFDAIVAIEMIEAVDWREYDDFFASCRRLLAPGGKVVLQAIVIPERRFDVAKRKDDFIKARIFPGGCLPSIAALTDSAARAADLRMVHLDDFGTHYAETLRRWRLNLDAMPPDIPAVGRDERFRRLWRFYLSYCEAGFDERDISVVQVGFAGADWSPALG